MPRRRRRTAQEQLQSASQPTGPAHLIKVARIGDQALCICEDIFSAHAIPPPATDTAAPTQSAAPAAVPTRPRPPRSQRASCRTAAGTLEVQLASPDPQPGALAQGPKFERLKEL